jgi:riboflavin kinase/FMN adenylyltransferase
MVMDVHRLNFKDLPQDLPKSACAIGYFDGLHAGHQSLIETAMRQAKEKDLVCGLITFDPDPWVLFQPDSNLCHLMSMEDKIAQAKNLGVEKFYILHFSFDFAAQDPDAFHEVLKKMHVQNLVCGPDFRYAYKNSGNIETLQACPDFKTTIVKELSDEQGRISSTRVEEQVKLGHMQEAARMLGMYYSLAGRVVHGYRRGTTLLKMPTANLQPSDHYVLPCEGVYFGYVQIKNRFLPAMINIGKNPTFKNEQLTIEAHIFDFNEDIYGKKVRFFFLKKIRDVKTFNGFEELKAQLEADMQTCKDMVDENDPLLERSRHAWIKQLSRAA